MAPREMRVFLLDALAAAEWVATVRDEIGSQRLREDELVRAAIERYLITIGEALHQAEGLDAELDTRISRLHAIVGLRNRLVHGYFAIEWSRVVAAVESDVDPLILELRHLLA